MTRAQVIQPGSIIATEFVETEADHKHLGILHLWKDKWRLESVPLQTMRPFKCKEVILADFEEASRGVGVDLSARLPLLRARGSGGVLDGTLAFVASEGVGGGLVGTLACCCERGGWGRS